MEVKWKVDITNPGACKSLSKELSASLPNFPLFLKENLSSANQNIPASSVYDFFLPILSTVQSEVYSLETRLSNITSESLRYQEKLNLVQQQSLQNPGKGLSLKSHPSSQTRSEHQIILSNIKRWSEAATIIQKNWKRYKCQKKFQVELEKIIVQVRPFAPRSVSNDEVMKTVLSEVEKRRLSLEQFYRAADKDCNGKVSFEELKSFMNDLKIVLPRSTVTRFMRIIDEDCSGFVTREEFFHALAAYNVSSEANSNARTYDEEMLLKFVKIMESREIEPENLFSLCDVDSSGSMSLKELENYLLKLKVGFQVKEVHALMKRLDTDGNGELSLDEFRRHFQKGQSFFRQEAVVSTSAVPLPVKGNDLNGLRELFRTLEYTGSLMDLLKTLQSSSNSEVSVSSFYIMMEKNFNCKLNRNQIDLIQKSLVLNNKGLISAQEFKSLAIFYTGKALGTRENYINRFKMHLPKTKCEEKIFTRKEMTEELFFSPEQCMESIQFLAEPGDEYISSDFFYVEKSHDEEQRVEKSEVVKCFDEKIKESGLDIRNIFRFADKNNTGMVNKDQIITAFSKLVKGITEKDLEDFRECFDEDSFNLEKLVFYFPISRLDQNGLTIEGVFWLRYLSRTFRDARMTSQEFFNKLLRNPEGFASFREIKMKIKDLFEIVIKIGRVNLIGEHVFHDDSSIINYEKFAQMLLSSQNSNHSSIDIKEYEKKVTSMNFDIVQPLPPPSPSPHPPAPQPKPINKSSILQKPLISVELSASLKKISQRVRENSWCGDLIKEFNLTLSHIFSKEEDLFFILRNFEISQNENQMIYNELKTLNNNHPIIHVYFFCTIVDHVTRSLNNLPFSWNKQIDTSVALVIESYIRKSGIRGLDLTTAHKNLQRKLDFTLFSDYFQDPEKIAGFFNANSPIYHFTAVVSSYIEEKQFSISNVMKSKFFFDYEKIKNRHEANIMKENLGKTYINEEDWKKEWLECKFFNNQQASQVFRFLFPKIKTIYPGYTFQYLLDVVEKNSMRNEEINFDPFNNDSVDPGHSSYFSELSLKLRYPISYYFSDTKLEDCLSIQTLKTELRKVFDSAEVVRLEIIDRQNVFVYHLLAILDSYREYPCNFSFDYMKIFRIFNNPRRREVVEVRIKNLSKEKSFEGDEMIKLKEDLIKITKDSHTGNKNPEEIKNLERMQPDQKEKELKRNKLKEEEELSDFNYFMDPFNKKKSIFGFQIIYLHELCTSRDRYEMSPMMLNLTTNQNIKNVFTALADLLKQNQISTLNISSIHLDKDITISDLASIKLFDNHKTKFASIIETLPNAKFFHFLSVLESYRQESFSSERFSKFPENFIRLIDKNKKLIEVLKNPPLHQHYDFSKFKQLFESCFPGISQEIIERLFKKIDKRSFNQVFMYEIMTAIDIMRYNSMKGVKISFIYRDEFQVMSENTGISSERYFRRKDAHRKYLEIAEYFDEHLVPTFRKKTILVMRGLRGEEFTGYEKISYQDLNSYIFRITNRNYELRFLFEDLKIEDTVTFYHFFAVLESYRKRVFVDEYKVDIDPLKAVNVAPIERNAESIRLPVDTSVLKPGSYEHDLYNIKVTVKADYNNIYSLFKQAAPEGSFKYDAFKRHLKEKINPRISEANLNELIRRVDKDRNQEVSLEEFFSYIFETPFEQSIQKQEQKFDSSRKLEPKDYFDPGQKNYSTILNSEETAIIKCKELLKNIPQGKLFEDPDFGPHLGRNGDECLYWNKVPPSSSYPNPHSEEFQWRHASDVFMQPDFIKQGTESGDVIQGSLGDCWFIGALSVMALRDDLLYGNMEDVNDPSEITIQNAKFMNKGVYSGIFHNLKDVGMFVFKFFINSAWRWVIVDDRLPMFVDSASGNSEYVFGHCRDKSELWVALIEKAYAKVFGCYEALNGGLIDDALTDLTGLVAEKCKISGPGGLLNLNLPDAQATEALWARLEQYRKDRTLMGCSIEGEGTEGDVVFEGEMTGLLSRHAYSIIDVLNLQDPQAPKGRHRLLRIRNPWGQREWMGKWRDHSEELEKFREQINAKTAELGEEEKFKKFDPNDGTFFMCFKDWRRIFHNLYACVDFSKEWFGKRFAGQWNVSNSGGVPLSGKPDECIRWAKNPQFCLELKANAEVFISLSQKDGRYARNSKFPFDDIINTACFTIMRGEQSELLLNRFDQGKIEKLSVLKAHRNIEMRIFLKAGKYFIVPSTMNAGKTGEFWLSVYFNSGKQNVSIFDCRNTADVGMIIQEEEEDEENYTEKDLELIRNKFLSLRHKI